MSSKSTLLVIFLLFASTTTAFGQGGTFTENGQYVANVPGLIYNPGQSLVANGIFTFTNPTSDIWDIKFIIDVVDSNGTSIGKRTYQTSVGPGTSISHNLTGQSGSATGATNHYAIAEVHGKPAIVPFWNFVTFNYTNPFTKR